MQLQTRILGFGLNKDEKRKSLGAPSLNWWRHYKGGRDRIVRHFRLYSKALQVIDDENYFQIIFDSQ